MESDPLRKFFQLNWDRDHICHLNIATKGLRGNGKLKNYANWITQDGSFDVVKDIQIYFYFSKI